MNKYITLGLAATAALIAQTSASVAIDLFVGDLRDNSGLLIADGTVGILVADTNGNGFDFANTLNGVKLTAGESIDGDLILQTYQSDRGSNGISGFVGGTSFNVVGGSPAGSTPLGAELSILWFVGVTALDSIVTSGTSFGVISNQPVNTGSGGDIGTNVPLTEGGSSKNLAYLDNTITGGASGLDNDFFTADMTVVPEPSSTALLGLGSVALFLRRRR